MSSNKGIRLNKTELEVLKSTFDLFDDDHSGKADIKNMKQILIDCGYKESNPVIFDIIAQMDTVDAKRKGGITFFDFIDQINSKLNDYTSDEGLRRIYDMFTDESKTIKKESLKQICKEIGRGYNDKELNELLDKIVKHSTDLSFEEFKKLMLGEYQV